MKKKIPVIKFSELKQLSFANSEHLPSPVDVLGRRMTWVGIGWIDEGPVKGDEKALVVDD